MLGTIVLRRPVTTVRWSNSAGRFRLLYDGGGVAVDSAARAGAFRAPPMTYHRVTVVSSGRWSLLLSEG